MLQVNKSRSEPVMGLSRVVILSRRDGGIVETKTGGAQLTTNQQKLLMT
jgi:hypothetical protein